MQPMRTSATASLILLCATRRISLVRLLASLILGAAPLIATDYYVSPNGNNRNDGGFATPWKTIAKVNTKNYSPGDRIFFRGGATFAGNLLFSESSGTPASPIVVSSYAGTRAVISAGKSYGMKVENGAGFYVANINFVGSGSSNTQSGILFYTTLSGNVKLDTVHIDHVDVGGFSTGILIGGWRGLTGYRNVSITWSTVHDNSSNGINIFGYYPVASGYPIQNVYIGHTRAYNNHGIVGAGQGTGSGIVVGNSDGVVIERSLAFNNGINNTHNGGPYGIWAWDSNHVVIQYNESHHNHTSSATDGGGFDLDGGVINSTLQYNYSHDNDGPGFLVCQYSGARRMNNNNTIRYNISQNDGRKNGAAGVQLWNGGSGIKNTQIFNNTIYMSPAGTRPEALWLVTATSNVSIRDNVFITTGGVPLLKAASGQTGTKIQGNVYWASGATFYIDWPSGTYTDLPTFRAATGQEIYNNNPVGAFVDPQLSAPGTGGSINNPDRLNTLSAYTPRKGSPVIDTALNLLTLFGVNPGPNDFLGDAKPRGQDCDIGAVEYWAKERDLQSEAGPALFHPAVHGLSRCP
jgi:hypothetical protein